MQYHRGSPQHILLYHPLIGKTVLGFGAKKTPAYVTHILTTKQHSCCCSKLPMSSHKEDGLPSGGYSSTQQGIPRRRTNCLLVWSARQQVRTLSYERDDEKKTKAVKKRRSRDGMHACTRPDGKAPELQANIATDETISLLVLQHESFCSLQQKKLHRAFYSVS